MNDAGWVALVVAFVTSAGGLYTAVTTKRKVDADSESVSVSTMQSVLESVRTELQRCHDERTDVLARLEAAEQRIAALGAYLKLNYDVDPSDINGHPI